MASNVPPSLKSIGNYVKIANENSNRDPVIYYWCLFYAVQAGMKLDKKSDEALTFIKSLLATLESVKRQLVGTEAISNEVVAQAHLENFAYKLFEYANEKERVGAVDKAVVHAFFTAGYVFDVLSLFGEIDEGVAKAKKYAKWKCMQINQCIKDGTPYIPSTQEKKEENDDDLFRDLANFGAPSQPVAPNSDITPFEQNYNAPAVPHHSHLPDSNNYGINASPSRPPAPAQNFMPPPTSNIFPAQPASPSPSTTSAPAAPGALKTPTFEEFTQAKKYIKYAMSAIDFEDTKAVVDNLRKALRLMEI